MSITPLKPQDEITIGADNLSRSAPRTWSEFMDAMEKYSSQQQLACISAPPDQVLRAQGKAMMIMELLELFKAKPKPQVRSP